MSSPFASIDADRAAEASYSSDLRSKQRPWNPSLTGRWSRRLRIACPQTTTRRGRVSQMDTPITFNLDAVKLKRRVIAPYTTADGEPKDWEETEDGNYRLTCPSNIWTDLTVPFWSMPENTDHPTQKPEKLLAKIILASSKPGDLVLDPFLGSGTTSVVAKKLGRRYIGIEIDEQFCCLAEKRLAMADRDNAIQGYSDG